MSDSKSTVDDFTLRNVETISKMDQDAQENRGASERAIDGFASIVGSWPFVVTQTVLLTAGLVLNVMAWASHWNPYPFILLNLGLSFQAAYASPILMMSQKRNARLSDKRNHLGLQINLLSEQENTEMLRLLRSIGEKLGIDVQTDELEAFEQATELNRVVEQIEESERQADLGEA